MTAPATTRKSPTFGAVILFIVAVVSAILLVVAGTVYAIWSTGNQVSASCDFWKSLATAPVKPMPPVKTPSKLGITIVASALEAYEGQGCGHIEPSPDLAKWAAFYHIPLPRLRA